jgi:hypothetical protein
MRARNDYHHHIYGSWWWLLLLSWGAWEQGAPMTLLPSPLSTRESIHRLFGDNNNHHHLSLIWWWSLSGHSVANR